MPYLKIHDMLIIVDQLQTHHSAPLAELYISVSDWQFGERLVFSYPWSSV